MHNSRSISPIHSQFNLANKCFSLPSGSVHVTPRILSRGVTLSSRNNKSPCRSIRSNLANISSSSSLSLSRSLRFSRRRNDVTGFCGSLRVSFFSITPSSSDCPDDFSDSSSSRRCEVYLRRVDRGWVKMRIFFARELWVNSRRENCLTVEHLAEDYFGTLWCLSLTKKKMFRLVVPEDCSKLPERGSFRLMAKIASVPMAICLSLLVKSVFCVAAAIYFYSHQ